MNHCHRHHETELPEIRCAECGKLLARGEVIRITIKCSRCKTYNTLRATSPNPEHREPPYRTWDDSGTH